jgi:hypothetical protein
MIEALRDIDGVAGAHLMAPIRASGILDVLSRVRPQGGR